MKYRLQYSATATRSHTHDLPDFLLSSASGKSCGIGLKPLPLRGGADEILGSAHDISATRTRFTAARVGPRSSYYTASDKQNLSDHVLFRAKQEREAKLAPFLTSLHHAPSGWACCEQT